MIPIISEEAYRANVAARWREIEGGSIEAKTAVLTRLTHDIKERHNVRLNRVLNDARMTTLAKIYAVWEAVDEIASVIAPRAACRKSCAHCCHISVQLPEQEAALIGKRLGIKPARVTRSNLHDEPHGGADYPCPFLKDNACSIYASRPLACRAYFNMDRDALLCQQPGNGTKVPYPNMLDYHAVLAAITLTREHRIERDKRTGFPVPVETITPPITGDIRDFFPNGIDKRTTRNASKKDGSEGGNEARIIGTA